MSNDSMMSNVAEAVAEVKAAVADKAGDAMAGAKKAVAKAKKAVAKKAGAAKKAVWALLPLLLLAIFFRPIRRAFLTSYLKIPLLPTTPSERIVYLWEYVRISVEDTGLDVPASDAVEETIDRVRKDGLDTTDLQVAADIYMRARYDMVLRPQDPIVMRAASIRAAKALRRTIPFGRKITNWWRSLA